MYYIKNDYKSKTVLKKVYINHRTKYLNKIFEKQTIHNLSKNRKKTTNLLKKSSRIEAFKILGQKKLSQPNYLNKNKKEQIYKYL